jgi:hypothetical protein
MESKSGHHVQGACHEAGGCFITFQWKPAAYSLPEIAEKNQTKVLKPAKHFSMSIFCLMC